MWATSPFKHCNTPCSEYVSEIISDNGIVWLSVYHLQCSVCCPTTYHDVFSTNIAMCTQLIPMSHFSPLPLHRKIVGIMSAPLYTNTPFPGAKLVLNNEGLPIYQGQTDVTFTVSFETGSTVYCSLHMYYCIVCIIG